MTIRNPSAEHAATGTEANRHQVQGERSTFQVEEASGVAFAEATGRAASPPDPLPVLSADPVPKRLPTASNLALPAAAAAIAAWLGLLLFRRFRRDLPTQDLHPDARHADERANLAADAQRPPPGDGTAAPLAAPMPDEIPMTGEEDPLVEVDNPEFSAVVAEFMRSERVLRTGDVPPERQA